MRGQRKALMGETLDIEELIEGVDDDELREWASTSGESVRAALLSCPRADWLTVMLLRLMLRAPDDEAQTLTTRIMGCLEISMESVQSRASEARAIGLIDEETYGQLMGGDRPLLLRLSSYLSTEREYPSDATVLSRLRDPSLIDSLLSWAQPHLDPIEEA